MAAPSTLTESSVAPAGQAPGLRELARAYCGPSHGLCWALDSAAPPRAVDIGSGKHRVTYRLVHNPRTRRPARDYLGNYLYMPVRHDVVT